MLPYNYKKTPSTCNNNNKVIHVTGKLCLYESLSIEWLNLLGFFNHISSNLFFEFVQVGQLDYIVWKLIPCYSCSKVKRIHLISPRSSSFGTLEINWVLFRPSRVCSQNKCDSVVLS